MPERFSSFRVGDAAIDRIEEQRFAIPIAALTDDAEFIAGTLASLPHGFLGPESHEFQFCGQSWLIRVDGLIVLVDPCNGNGRVRPRFPMFTGIETPWLDRLAAAGVQPEQVDHVFCTHLHCDHCGWNVRAEGDRWVPTFPNARYHFVEREYRRWEAGAAPGDDAITDYNDSVFAEAVQPIVEAGLAELVTPPCPLSSSLTIEPAEGHTAAHAMLRLESGGAIAYFAGDALHHPAQIFRPELHLRGCDDLPRAIATRREIFTRAAREGAFLFPAHFAAPHHGRVIDMGGAFRFVPGGAETGD